VDWLSTLETLIKPGIHPADQITVHILTGQETAGYKNGYYG
jgi:hypothetical protein